MMSISRMIVNSMPPRKKPAKRPSRTPPVSDRPTETRPDHERQARAVDQPRQDVAADRVGAEQEHVPADRLQRRRLQGRVAVLLVRRMRRDDVGEQRGQDQRDDDAEADDRAAVAAKVAPQLGPWRRRRVGRDRAFGHGVHRAGPDAHREDRERAHIGMSIAVVMRAGSAG
jgi:hypothetical protein